MQSEKELRLALVCFGGVSLAVYMHGVTKEVLKLVRASRRYHDTGAFLVHAGIDNRNPHPGALSPPPGRRGPHPRNPP